MTGLLAIVVGQSLGLPLRDPEGFLGPAWIRLPLLVLGAFLADVLPRAAWRSRGKPSQFRAEARGIVQEHWTRERIMLVVIGLVSFYVTYVSYRNLKSFLPFVRSDPDAAPGEVTAVSGASGSGKSTLLDVEGLGPDVLGDLAGGLGDLGGRGDEREAVPLAAGGPAPRADDPGVGQLLSALGGGGAGG